MLTMTILTTQAKIITSSCAVLALMVGDSVTGPDSWEDWSMKGLLVLAIGWLVRELGAARKEAKEEREAHAAEARVREGLMTVAMHTQAVASEKVCTAIQEQTEYFKGLAKGLIERGLNTGSGTTKLP